VATFSDSDLVYIDPNNRTVIGPVEWLPSGKAKAMPIPERKGDSDAAEGTKEKEQEKEKGHRKRRSNRKQYYPWCSYRTARRVYRVEGKEKEPERSRPLEEAMQKAVAQPYWD